MRALECGAVVHGPEEHPTGYRPDDASVLIASGAFAFGRMTQMLDLAIWMSSPRWWRLEGLHRRLDCSDPRNLRSAGGSVSNIFWAPSR